MTKEIETMEPNLTIRPNFRYDRLIKRGDLAHWYVRRFAHSGPRFDYKRPMIFEFSCSKRAMDATVSKRKSQIGSSHLVILVLWFWSNVQKIQSSSFYLFWLSGFGLLTLSLNNLVTKNNNKTQM